MSIATVYIIDYHNRQDPDEKSLLSAALNQTTKVKEEIEIQVISRQEEDVKITLPAPATRSVLASSSTEQASTTMSTATFRSSAYSPASHIVLSEVPILGSENVCSDENPEKCQVYCCPQNRSGSGLGGSFIKIQSPPSILVPKSTSSKPYAKTPSFDKLYSTSSTTLTTTGSTSTTSSADREKKLKELQNLESEKDNQVQDDVTKPTTLIDIKEIDKIDMKSIGKETTTSTDKPGSITKSKPSQTKSLKKDANANEVDTEGEHFNEVDYEDEVDPLKNLNETAISNTTDEEYELQPQRAKRDITFGDLKEQLGHLMTGLVRRIRDTGQSIINEKKHSRPLLSLIGKFIAYGLIIFVQFTMLYLCPSSSGVLF